VWEVAVIRFVTRVPLYAGHDGYYRVSMLAHLPIYPIPCVNSRFACVAFSREEQRKLSERKFFGHLLINNLEIRRSLAISTRDYGLSSGNV
jgi:hypothetical protein